MSASKQNFFAAHWDWLAAAAGCTALLVAGAFFVLSMGDSPEASADAFEASLKAQKPSHEGVDPANLTPLQNVLRQTKTPPKLDAIDPKKANFLASEARVFCQQGDAASKEKACGRPIPADSEVCPYCKVKQNVVKIEADADHDGLPNEWEVKFGLNPNDPSDAKKDLDGDGYTNLEEFLAKTDPTDKESHPDYLDSVVVSAPLKKTTLPFYFNAHMPIRSGHRLTFWSVEGKGKCLCVKGEEVVIDPGKGKKISTGWVVDGFEEKSELRERAGLKGVKVPVDVSIVTLKRAKDGKSMKIVRGIRENPIEEETELTYKRGKELKFTVSKGAEFELRGNKYRVEKLRAVENGCEVTVIDLKTKKEKTLR